MIKKYTDVRQQDEQRYEETSLIDATDENGNTVRVVDDRNKRLHTESQIDAQLVTAQEQVDKLQAIKDSITSLKEA